MSSYRHKFPDLQDWMKSDNRELRSNAYDILTDAKKRRRVDAIVTHFLERAYNLPGFSETMSDWKKDEKLVKYVVETEMIIGPCT